MLRSNSILRDKLFGDHWTVVGPEERGDGALFYRLRNHRGEELSLAEWAVHYFELLDGRFNQASAG